MTIDRDGTTEKTVDPIGLAAANMYEARIAELVAHQGNTLGIPQALNRLRKAKKAELEDPTPPPDPKAFRWSF